MDTTKDEFRVDVLAKIRMCAISWAQVDDVSEYQRCEGVAHSILAAPDETAGLPPCDFTAFGKRITSDRLRSGACRPLGGRFFDGLFAEWLIDEKLQQLFSVLVFYRIAHPVATALKVGILCL